MGDKPPSCQANPPKMAEISQAIRLITNDKRVFWFLLPMFYTAVKKAILFHSPMNTHHGVLQVKQFS